MSQASNEVPWDNVFEALLTYEEKNKDMNVPLSFIVPESDVTWPQSLHGMKLGKITDNIRSANAYKDHKEELLEMGFDYEKQDDWKTVKSALLTYKFIHGNIQVPSKFKVPNKDSAWGDELLGYSLGIVVQSIRNKGKYAKHKDELIAMGFDMKK